jgi:hypothetical protein
MKHIFLALGLLISILGFSQTTKLTCYNCQAIPKAYCAPCASGLTGTEYTSGIVVDRGPSNRVFIKKPFSWFVSGQVFTVTDYTGKSISFKATETIYGNVPAVVATLTDCNCPSTSGGGGGPGSFNLTADVGEDSISGELSILTGPVLKSTLVGSALTIDWDVSMAASHSVPYYTGSSVGWRTFATGIADDPTVGGSDATGLQTILNNLNTAIGGGGGGSYTASNGLTLATSNFKLGGTLIESTTINATTFPFQLNQSATWAAGSLGGRFHFNGGSAGSYGTYIGSRNTTNLSEFSALGSNTTHQTILESTGSWARVQTLANSGQPIYTVDVVDGSEGSDLTIYTQTRKEFIYTDIQRFSTHALAWAGITNNALYKLNNDPTVYHKQSTGQTYTSAPQAITKYAVTITGGNSGSSLTIVSSGTGVTASFASNKLTIVIPTGVRVLSADWLAVSADVQASADAGGVTNWVNIEFQGTGGNTGLSDINIPTVQKTAVPSSGALSATNAATLDLDNNPAISVIGVGSGNINMRVGGLSVGGQGYHFKVTNI